MTRRTAILIALYAAVGVVTFGHAAAKKDAWYAQTCGTVDERIAAGSGCYLTPGAAALPAMIFWPFYWSWTAFEVE